MKTYRTSELARLAGVHPNTVRLYEQMGWITPPLRRTNGYRIFTERHQIQMELVRLALRAEVLQNGLRKQAVTIVRLCAASDLDQAATAAHVYETMIEREMERARDAVSSVESVLAFISTDLSGIPGSECTANGRREAADRLDISVDTLRNWERNGLLADGRVRYGARLYNASDLSRLNIIRTLRSANYSLASIRRLLTQLDYHGAVPVAKILNTPAKSEDIISVCDRLLVSLETTLRDARRMQSLLETMRTTPKTLQ